MSLPTIPSTGVITYAAVFQQPAQFTSLTNSQTFLLFGIPAGYVICGTKISPLVRFLGVPSATVSIGTSGNSTSYGSAYELTQTITPSTFQTSSPLALNTNVAHDVVAVFVTAASRPAAITSGAVEISVQIRPL